MKHPGYLLTALLTLPMAESALADDTARCASNISELRRLLGDSAFPLRWTETSMDDGKPMVVTLQERNGALALRFIKSSEGVWAEGTGTLCRKGTDIEARLGKDQLRLGPAAHWLVRMTLADGGTFTLHRPTGRQLQITTQGWSGRFVPAADE